MIVAILVIASIGLGFASVAAFVWPFVDQEKLVEGLNAYYEQRKP